MMSFSSVKEWRDGRDKVETTHSRVFQGAFSVPRQRGTLGRDSGRVGRLATLQDAWQPPWAGVAGHLLEFL